jgi:hypothetical protein
VSLTCLLILVIGNRDQSIGKHVDCCVDAVWIVALKAAACFKTRFWALFMAAKAKFCTIGCRIVVANKLDPLPPPSLFFWLSKSAVTVFSMVESVLYGRALVGSCRNILESYVG